MGILQTIRKRRDKERKGKKYNDLFEVNFYELYEECRPFSRVSIERFYALYNSIEYLVNNGIVGDFVECGVWRGGSALFMAKCLERRGDV